MSAAPRRREGAGEGEAPAPSRSNHYRNGRNFEYRVRQRLVDAGYMVFRSAGSKTKLDLLAIKPGAPMLFIQCKRGGRFPTEEWNALCDITDDAAMCTGFLPILATGGRGNKFWRLRRKVRRGQQPEPFNIQGEQ